MGINCCKLRRNYYLEEKVNSDPAKKLPLGMKWIIYKNYPYAISSLCLYTIPCQHKVWNMTNDTYKFMTIEQLAKKFNVSEYDLWQIHL
jgi:hypothetical protein